MISDDAPDPRNGKIIQCRVLAPDPLGPVGRFVSGALARGTLSLCGWSPSPPPVPNFRRPSTARVRQSPCHRSPFFFLPRVFLFLARRGLVSFTGATILRSATSADVCATRRVCTVVVRKSRRLLSLPSPPALSPPVFFSLMYPCALSAARCT